MTCRGSDRQGAGANALGKLCRAFLQHLTTFFFSGAFLSLAMESESKVETGTSSVLERVAILPNHEEDMDLTEASGSNNGTEESPGNICFQSNEVIDTGRPGSAFKRDRPAFPGPFSWTLIVPWHGNSSSIKVTQNGEDSAGRQKGGFFFCIFIQQKQSRFHSGLPFTP